MITLQQKCAALEALGYDCDTSAGEIVSWRDSRPMPETWEEIIESAQAVIDAKEIRAQARAALAAQWATFPAWIRGPFGATYSSAITLLDAGDDDAAAALIRYSTAPATYSSEQLETFLLIQSSLLVGIESLPSH